MSLIQQSERIEQSEKKNYAIAFGLNFFFAFMVFIPFIVKGAGVLTLFGDFNTQEIPFNILANHAIKGGETLWNWNVDLGTSFLGAFSFYNLGSPFFWISLLAPAKAFPYLIGFIYMLKYAVAGLTSYAYIRRFVEKAEYAIMASVLYAFSGFSATNLMFYHFHDVVALFPLVLLGLDLLMIEKKKGVFALAVFFNAFLNYFFFIGEVVFVILYFMIRYILPEWKGITSLKEAAKKSGTALFEGALGVIMAGALFIPSIVFVLNNPRVSNLVAGADSLGFTSDRIFRMLRALFFPGEMMGGQSCIVETSYSSCAAYLPMVSIVLVIAYLLKQKNWLTCLIKTCAVFALIPFLNSLFVMLNEHVYYRWYYMPVLILALISGVVLEKREEYPIASAAKISAAIAVGVTLFLRFYPWSKEMPVAVIRFKVYYLFALIGLAGIVATWILCTKIKNQKNVEKLLLLGIVIFAVGSTFFTTYLYKQAGGVDARKYMEKQKAVAQIKTPDERYRFASGDNTIIMTVPLKGDDSFCTTVSGSIFEFYDSLAIERDSGVKQEVPGRDEFLSARYHITEDKEEAKEPIQTVTSGNTTYYVYENTNVPAIGYTFSSFMTKDEFLLLDESVRIAVLENVLIVPDTLYGQVSSRLPHYEESTFGTFDPKEIDAYANAHQAECATSFETTTKGFTSTLKVAKDTYAFYTVPYDKNWTITVNGTEVTAINSNGFLCFPVETGVNHIKASYHDASISAGIVASIVGFICWIFVMIRQKKRKTSQQA